jgi:hypothetical protein
MSETGTVNDVVFSSEFVGVRHLLLGVVAHAMSKNAGNNRISFIDLLILDV